jgi:hypothetical protein
VDDPVKMGSALISIFSTLGDGLPEGDDGVKMDVGHVMFSRLGRKMRRANPHYCKLGHSDVSCIHVLILFSDR